MKTSYIFVGDSIVYGIGDFEQNGWTSMFKNKILRNGVDTIEKNR